MKKIYILFLSILIIIIPTLSLSTNLNAYNYDYDVDDDYSLNYQFSSNVGVMRFESVLENYNIFRFYITDLVLNIVLTKIDGYLVYQIDVDIEYTSAIYSPIDGVVPDSIVYNEWLYYTNYIYYDNVVDYDPSYFALFIAGMDDDVYFYYGFVNALSETGLNPEVNVISDLTDGYSFMSYEIADDSPFSTSVASVDMLLELTGVVYNDAYDSGYWNGYNDGSQFSFDEAGWFDWFFSILSLTNGILALEFIEGLSIGMIIGVPLMITIVAFIVGIMTSKRN